MYFTIGNSQIGLAVGEAHAWERHKYTGDIIY